MTCYQTLNFEPFDADHKEMVRCQAILVIFVLKYLKRQVKTTCKVGDWQKGISIELDGLIEKLWLQIKTNTPMQKYGSLLYKEIMKIFKIHNHFTFLLIWNILIGSPSYTVMCNIERVRLVMMHASKVSLLQQDKHTLNQSFASISIFWTWMNANHSG